MLGRYKTKRLGWSLSPLTREPIPYNNRMIIVHEVTIGFENWLAYELEQLLPQNYSGNVYIAFPARLTDENSGPGNATAVDLTKLIFTKRCFKFFQEFKANRKFLSKDAGYFVKKIELIPLPFINLQRKHRTYYQESNDPAKMLLPARYAIPYENLNFNGDPVIIYDQAYHYGGTIAIIASALLRAHANLRGIICEQTSDIKKFAINPKSIKEVQSHLGEMFGSVTENLGMMGINNFECLAQPEFASLFYQEMVC